VFTEEPEPDCDESLRRQHNLAIRIPAGYPTSNVNYHGQTDFYLHYINPPTNAKAGLVRWRLEVSLRPHDYSFVTRRIPTARDR
jgi:hypothetical protein